jgi:hypothetical protein
MRTNSPLGKQGKQIAPRKNKLRLTIADKLLMVRNLRNAQKLFFLGRELFFLGAVCLCYYLR